MNSNELNIMIDKLGDKETFDIVGLEGTGKCIPYIGWYWRTVNFDSPIHLGHCGKFVGFMENNKWGYQEKECTKKDSKQIIILLEKAVKTPTNETLQKAFDYIQESWDRAKE
jgi:hypothetical protein